MKKDHTNIEKSQLETEINSIASNRNTLRWLAGGYSLVSAFCLNEWLMNDCTLSTLYIPIILGSIGVSVYSLKNMKKNTYKLKKLKTELSMIEFKENTSEKVEAAKYLLKK